VTSWIRVPELIEEIEKHKIDFYSKEGIKIPTDTIILPMVNGSPDYIEWIHVQTMKKSLHPEFANMLPEPDNASSSDPKTKHELPKLSPKQSPLALMQSSQG
jgi:hypothetical protein